MAPPYAGARGAGSKVPSPCQWDPRIQQWDPLRQTVWPELPRKGTIGEKAPKALARPLWASLGEFWLWELIYAQTAALSRSCRNYAELR